MDTIHGPGGGEALWYDGGLLTIKATGRETSGSLLLFEVWMPKGKATPLHVHDEEETFYVIDGEILTHLDGVEQTLSTGACATVARRTPHAFAVISEVKMLVALTPHSDVSERFFRAASEPATALTLSPKPPLDIPTLQAAAKEAGMEILGPPPFEMSEVLSS